MNNSQHTGFQWSAVTLLLLLSGWVMAQHQPVVSLENGQLVYAPDSLGNRLPDFSYAGYDASEETIPLVPVAVVVFWQPGDQTRRIQKAIDYVGTLPLNADGFRGAILLEQGTFELAGGLEMTRSGVVLRGSGAFEEGTTLLGTGLDRTTLIRVQGEADQRFSDETSVADAYVPVGAVTLSVVDGSALQEGDEIEIIRSATAEWIAMLQMEDFGGETGYIGWKPDQRNIHWNRTVLSVIGNKLTLDAPITTALDQRYGGGVVHKVDWPGRIDHIGIENLRLTSTFNPSNPKDEQHRWMGITMENLRDGWVRQVIFEHFAGSAVAIWNTASRITVEDCLSLNPVSEIGGQRRYTFFIAGQQCLFQRLYAEYGYHDFGVGFMAAGPNAFVECQSYLPYSFSGTIDSWASGVLFDLVNVDGQALRFSNRGMEAQGAGWTAANSMMWQCTAALVDCPAPPMAMNWAYAVWSQFSGNGGWYEANGFLKPRSLFYGQLAGRLGTEVLERAQLLPLATGASSSPTIQEAVAYVEASRHPSPQLKEWIAQAPSRHAISLATGKARKVDQLKLKTSRKQPRQDKPLQVYQGKLAFGNLLATGNRKNVQWWRGNVRTDDVEKAEPHITRYVPGREGIGYTDKLEESVEWLLSRNVAVLDHNYGLWYDRRRDDHERVRRMNGEVWAPFYELPFARSGEGVSWDGMSTYDLTTYNVWYWSRLRHFVELADHSGLVLYHQHYFQHNILEAGAHYADFPWRSANNINETPFPEPVNYAGDKRVFMAEQFYDLSNPEYRGLHEAYIRKCLDNFRGQSNVIHFTSAEYTGPLSFVKFWLGVVQQWERETGQDVLIALSATKDVQDAILQDPDCMHVVDVIDLRYWWYGQSKDGSSVLYAPEGGKNLAPRQHARLVKTPKETFESTYKAVAAYHQQYPEKAIIYNTDRSSVFGWAIFMAGGSLMNVPRVSEPTFFNDALKMRYTSVSNGYYTLMNPATGERIIYADSSKSFTIDLSDNEGEFDVSWVDTITGKVKKTSTQLLGGQKYEIKEVGSKMLWLDKN